MTARQPDPLLDLIVQVSGGSIIGTGGGCEAVELASGGRGVQTLITDGDAAVEFSHPDVECFYVGSYSEDGGDLGWATFPPTEAGARQAAEFAVKIHAYLNAP